MSERVEPETSLRSPPDEPANPTAQPAAPAPGVRLLSGRYRLGEVLGYGGMAEVYKARDVRLDRDVAIKLLRADLARDSSFKTRFRREAQSAAGLAHPMIVSVYDTGSDERHDPPLPYIVMEYVEGRTLRDVLQLDGRLTQHRAVEIIRDVCSALEYSHRTGIVHRDIKPGNVMITRDGSVKVMDFGIARAIAQSTATVTQTAAVMGTAQYLSPEQARGETVDARSDLYSAGVVLYELLTGRPPFQGDSPVAVAYQHVREDPVPPSDLEPDLAGDVDAVVMKMLAKNPANRYQNAAEMRDDLNRLLGGRRVLATPLLREHPSPAPKRARRVRERKRRRRPSGKRLLLIALLTLLAGGAVTGGLLLAQDSGSTDTTVAVPPLTGMSLDNAKRTLIAAGLRVGGSTPKASSTVKVNIVLSSNPVAGVKLQKDAAVRLTYSSGPATQDIPAGVIGSTPDAAEAALRKAGLTWKLQSVVTPGKPVNTVSGTQPAFPATIVVTEPVTLLVESPFTKVPPLVGETISAAQSDLFDADLSIGNIISVDSSVTPGQVLNQSLPPNSGQLRHASITLIVSKAPTPTPSPTPSPTAKASKGAAGAGGKAKTKPSANPNAKKSSPP